MSYSKTAKYSSFLYGSNQEIEQKVHAISRIVPDTTHSILEIGAGDGSLAMALCRQGYEVTALEESDTFFAIVLDRFSREKELRPLLTPIPTSLTEYSGTKFFDLVIATKFFSHVPSDDWLRLFSLIRSFLKPSGKFIFDCAKFSKLRVDQPWQEIQKRVFGHNSLHHNARSRRIEGNPLVQVDFEFILRTNQITVSKEEESHLIYLVNPEQVLFELRGAGFDSLQTFSGWTLEPSSQDDPSILVLAHVE